MAKGKKSLGEERRERLERFGKRWREQYGNDIPVPPYADPDRPENNRIGTCPWCGNGQAQIMVFNDEDDAGKVHDSYESGKYVSGMTMARVCLTCGRVELTDSKPGR